MPRRGDVLTSIRSEAARPVVENQVARGWRVQCLGGDHSRAGGSACSGRWVARHRCGTTPFELIRERPVGVADDDAGNRLQQNVVCFGDPVGAAHKQPARFIEVVCVAARQDQLRDLFVQGGRATGLPFAQDHEVDDQSVQAPRRVGLHKLARQLKVRRVCHAQQDDRQIARNRAGPKTRLAAVVPDEDGRVGAK